MHPEVPTIPPAALRGLRRRFAGRLVRPSDRRYPLARKVWNDMVDRYPLLVAQCSAASDVAAAVTFARDLALPIAVRGGGHSVAGYGTCDNGIVVDLSGMTSIRVDPTAQLVDVAGGVRWGLLDTETGRAGLATTGGLVSTTGVAGLTLGGGIGWLMRAHGLTCDNLAGAEVITPQGDRLWTDEEHDPELFWALRGGGGNFGIVTSFRFRLHPVDTVLGGMLLFDSDAAQDVLAAWDEGMASAPDGLTTLAAFITTPPAPPVPEELRGRRMLAIALCWCKGTDEGESVIAPLRALPALRADLVAPMPYRVLQTLQDAAAPAGLRNYWKSGFLARLEPETGARLAEGAARAVGPLAQVHVHQLGGAVARVQPDATPFAHRSAAYAVNVIASWTDPADDGASITWARELYAAIEPSLDGAYVNFLGAEGTERVRAAYGAATYARLARVKARLDPHNLLQLNHNVLPAAPE